MANGRVLIEAPQLLIAALDDQRESGSGPWIHVPPGLTGWSFALKTGQVLADGDRIEVMVANDALPPAPEHDGAVQVILQRNVVAGALSGMNYRWFKVVKVAGTQASPVTVYAHLT